MNASFVVRSVLALLFCMLVATFAFQHGALQQESALQAAIDLGNASGGPVLSGATTPRPSVKGTHVKPAATPTPVVVKPADPFALFPSVPGHIIYVGADHNLRFVTGKRPARQLTGDGVSTAPALSPDGSRLAWVLASRNASDIVTTQLSYGKDGAISAAPYTQLTQDASPPPKLQTVALDPGVYDPRYQWYATKPSWMPDGIHLLYQSDRPGFNPINPTQTDMSIYEQGVTDTITDAVRLTTPTLAEIGSGGADSASWRPNDPAVFLYVSYYHGTDLPGGEGTIKAAMTLTMTAPQGDNSIGLTPRGATEFQPAWSPDGHYIAFAENKTGGRSDLKVMAFHRPGRSFDYDKAITVAEGSPYVVQPFWSPDGRWLGYLASTSVGGSFSLYLRAVSIVNKVPQFRPAVLIPQAGTAGADYRPTWTTR